MKKILIPILVLTLLISTGTTVLAWDEEDPCVADNEDFWIGGSHDFDVTPSWQEFHYGEQVYNWGDGYNLYRDDVSNTGYLDEVLIMTLTPDEIDLPNATQYGPFTEMWDMCTDAYYWATEPEGIDYITKADFLKGSGVPGKGLDTAPGLQKPFNPKSQAEEHAGKK